MTPISKTGYWAGETAHIHHVHSKPLSNWIINYLKGQEKTKIWDLGCGLGNYLKDLEEAGFTSCVGVEGDIPTKAVFPKILKYDITNPIRSMPKGNVICLEVMEHIPYVFMERVLKNIQYLCTKHLIMSWAIRNQPGHGHVNCLDNHEVIKLLEDRGFMFMDTASEEARKVIDDTTPWFKNTLLIFKKVDKNDEIDQTS